MKTQTKKIHQYGVTIAILLFPFLTSAQEVSSENKLGPLSKVPDVFYEPTTYLWILIFSILAGVLIALSRAVKVLGNALIKKKEGESHSEPVIEQVHEDSVWTRLMKLMTSSVPVEQEADVMLDHDYDGIRELDNQLPPWWVWGFYLTIIFAFIYLIHYHVTGSGDLQAEEYNSEIRIAEIEKENRIKNDLNYVTDANVVASLDPAVLAEGQSIYTKNCLACHGNAGQGGVGPNLTDQFWIHGGGIKNVFKVVTSGVPDKGMISWKSQLSPAQIKAVSSFILTLEGTNPPDPKEPQGDKWEEPVVTASSDTTQAKINEGE